MTPEEIRDLLFLPISKERIEKAKGNAQRHKIEWQRVLDVMSDYQRQQINEAQ